MKILLICAVLIASVSLQAQKQSPTKIIITLADTVGAHQKVKEALIRSNFIVKDLPGDTITTYPKNASNIPGSAVAIAIINDNHVTLTGFYSLKRKTYFGFDKMAGYKKITKYKGSKMWPVLENIAEKIGDDLTYQ